MQLYLPRWFYKRVLYKAEKLPVDILKCGVIAEHRATKVSETRPKTFRFGQIEIKYLFNKASKKLR